MKPDDVAVESWYLGREKKFISWKNDDPDITKMWTSFYKLCHEEKSFPNPNVSMLKVHFYHPHPPLCLPTMPGLTGVS